MTAGNGSAAAPLWRRHRLKVAGVALVAWLAWLVYYLEHLPVSRDFGVEESRLTLIDDDANEAVRFGDVPLGAIGTFRSVTAKRLKLTIQGPADMKLPELEPFLAKAALQKAQLSENSCGKDYVVIDAVTEPGENATVALSLDAPAGSKSDGAALLIAKTRKEYRDGIMVRADNARLNLAVSLNRSDEHSPVGTMTLCRSGVSATLGVAEFELAPGQPFFLEFRDPDSSAADLPSARFDLQDSLPVSSIAVGHLYEQSRFEPNRIACGAAASGQKLWAKFLPDVDLDDCRTASLTVTEIPVKGAIRVDRAPAFFSNYDKDRDRAGWFTKATSNPVVGALVLGLIGGTILPWVYRQFWGEKRRASARKPTRKPQAKK